MNVRMLVGWVGFEHEKWTYDNVWSICPVRALTFESLDKET